MTREEILDIIVDLYEQFEISIFGFDLLKFIKDMGINLIPYSSFDSDKQMILSRYDEDGFNLINPKNNKIEIYYNDRIIPEKRKKFTLPHEIGHICLGHNCKFGDETIHQKREANMFANEFYCPQAFMIEYNLSTKSDLMSAFDITEGYAQTLLDKLNKRKNKGLSKAESKLVDVFKKNIKKKG